MTSGTTKSSIRPWIQLSDRLLQKTFAFDLRAKMMRSPDGSYEGDFFYLECPNWANVVGLTEKDEVILVEQFRHGIAESTLEAPGGIVDPHEVDPQAAAIREMEEETGYTVGSVEPLGVFNPNPAILTNSCYLYLARNCRRIKAPQLDAAEDIAVHLIPLKEIPALIAAGKIKHCIALNALLLLLFKVGNLTFPEKNS